MTNVLLVTLGGGVGSALRYLVTLACTTLFGAQAGPLGTLTVNLMGCFVIGALAQYSESVLPFTPAMRALLVVGVLGGFTTYSTFANESLNFGLQGMPMRSVLFMAVHIVVGLLAVWLGRLAVAAVFS